MFRIFALCCTLIVSGYAAADKESVALFKDYLPHQILEMPEEERSQSVPIMFIGAASLGTSKAGAVILQAQLNTLMYEGLADSAGANESDPISLDTELA